MKKILFMLSILSVFFVMSCDLLENLPKEDEVPQQQATTPLQVTLLGEDASLFKLAIMSDLKASSSATVQESPATWQLNISESSSEIHVSAFIDANNNNVMEDSEMRTGSIFTAEKEVQNNYAINLGKTTVHVTLLGDLSGLTNPKLIHNGMQSGSSSRVISAINTSEFITYCNTTGKYGARGYLNIFQDLDNDNYRDSAEPYEFVTHYGWDYTNDIHVILELDGYTPALLPENGEIGFRLSDTALHYGFVFDNNQNKHFFIVPIGENSDGAGVTCFLCEDIEPADQSGDHSGDHLWKLFDSVYGNWTDNRSDVIQNYNAQNELWVQNLKDLIRNLEEEKGLTVEGKDLVGM